MNGSQAAAFAYNELRKHGLGSWSVRISKAQNHSWFLGLCSYKDKCIIVNGFHVEMHPEAEVINTIRHEVAHALCPNHGHDEIWAAKAREIGCDNTNPCSHLSLSPNIIDAIRSGADIELEVEEQVIRTVRHKVNKIQERCGFPNCGKVAEEVDSKIIEGPEFDMKVIKLVCGHTLTKALPKATPFGKLLSEDGKTPYPFQVEGMKFLEMALAVGKGGAVFDEMGLGKTVQALGYIKFCIKEQEKVIYCVKSATTYQWVKEIYRWSGNIAQVIEKSTDIPLPVFNHFVVSYDLLVPKVKKLKSGKIVQQGFDVNKLIRLNPKLVILDECQQIKNIDSSRTQQIKILVKNQNTKVIGLSGTPWKNRGSEFFSILNMLDPVKFPSYTGYLTKWVRYYAHGNQWKEGGINDPVKFREYIKDLAIRREVDEVMKEMPEVNRTIFTCNLDDFNQKEYDDEVSDFVKKMNQKAIDGEDDNIASIIGDLQRMRHITGISKIPVTVEWCKEFAEETDRKLVIFAHHIDVQQILYMELQKEIKGIPIVKITGDMNPKEKWEAQEKFNNSPRAFMVASTLAAGEGLNLQTCADGIMHERQWNPANEDQAAPGRFRRIGQTKNMNVIFITAKGTIDEFMANLVEAKRKQFHEVMNKGEMITWNEGSLIKELVDMIVKDHNKKKKKAS